MWPPASAHRSRAQPRPPDLRFLLGVSGLLAAYKIVLAAAPAGLPRAPLGAAVAAGIYRAGRRRGLTREQSGLGASELAAGLRWGGVVAGTAALGAGAMLSLPRARPLLRDRRLEGLTAPAAARRVLVDIPLETVLLEEVAFRGVLHGAALPLVGRRAAAAWSSCLFGLWHIGPALDFVRGNAATRDVPGGPTVTATVAATAVAGYLLTGLRERTGGIVATVVAHWGANAAATVASFLSPRITPSRPIPPTGRRPGRSRP